MKPFLERLTAKDFGPIRDASLALTPLHALIGPNDTGKSSLLGFIQRVSSWLPGGAVALEAPEGPAVYGMVVTSDGGSWAVGRGKNGALSGTAKTKQVESTSATRAVGHVLRSVRKLRLDPDEIRAPTDLLSDDKPLDFENERGRGLGSVLDAIFSRKPSTFLELQSRLVELFPTVEGFRLFTERSGRQIGIRLKSGVEVRPESMSEGMLYFLAFAVVPFLHETSILLVEEPENGLHPSRIADVMRVLRKVSETTQVIVATHSPLVVNELEPDEVTIVTRDAERGTILTPMRETKDFEQRSRIYALGELWLSYANGVDEAALLNGRA